jgi:hypothetical protein
MVSSGGALLIVRSALRQKLLTDDLEEFVEGTVSVVRREVQGCTAGLGTAW